MFADWAARRIGGVGGAANGHVCITARVASTTPGIGAPGRPRRHRLPRAEQASMQLRPKASMQLRAWPRCPHKMVARLWALVWRRPKCQLSTGARFSQGTTRPAQAGCPSTWSWTSCSTGAATIASCCRCPTRTPPTTGWPSTHGRTTAAVSHRPKPRCARPPWWSCCCERLTAEQCDCSPGPNSPGTGGTSSASGTR
jgi:hypothetical protein